LDPFWKGFAKKDRARRIFLEAVIPALHGGRDLTFFDKNRHRASDKFRRSDRLMTARNNLTLFLANRVAMPYRPALETDNTINSK
jgi:hypothetical protein